MDLQPQPTLTKNEKKKIKRREKQIRNRSNPTTGVDWTNLPDYFVLSLFDRLSPSVPDALGLSSVCTQWRSLFKSPDISPLPQHLHLNPQDSPSPSLQNLQPLSRRPTSPTPHLTKYFVDFANGYFLLGHSHGHLIFISRPDKAAVVADVSSPAEFRSPKLPYDYSCVDIHFGFLHRSPRSPSTSSCTLFLFTWSSEILFWRLGSSSDWLGITPDRSLKIQSGTVFNGQIVCLVDDPGRLLVLDFTSGMTPGCRVMEVGYDHPVEGWVYSRSLVACGSELFLVLFVQDEEPPSSLVRSRLYEFDFGNRTWGEVGSIGDWCLFRDRFHSGYLACAKPRRWGGRSNCVYVLASDDDGDEGKEIALDGGEFDRSLLCCKGSKLCVYPSTLSLALTKFAS